MLLFSDRVKLDRYFKGWCMVSGVDYYNPFNVFSFCVIHKLLNESACLKLLEGEENNDSTNN